MGTFNRNAITVEEIEELQRRAAAECRPFPELFLEAFPPPSKEEREAAIERMRKIRALGPAGPLSDSTPLLRALRDGDDPGC